MHISSLTLTHFIILDAINTYLTLTIENSEKVNHDMKICIHVQVKIHEAISYAMSMVLLSPTSIFNFTHRLDACHPLSSVNGAHGRHYKGL